MVAFENCMAGTCTRTRKSKSTSVEVSKSTSPQSMNSKLDNGEVENPNGGISMKTKAVERQVENCTSGSKTAWLVLPVLLIRQVLLIEVEVDSTRQADNGEVENAKVGISMNTQPFQLLLFVEYV